MRRQDVSIGNLRTTSYYIFFKNIIIAYTFNLYTLER